MRRKPKIVVITVLFMIFTLIFTLFIVIKDISTTNKKELIDLSTPETTINSIQDAIEKKSYIMLEEIFIETLINWILKTLN